MISAIWHKCLFNGVHAKEFYACFKMFRFFLVIFMSSYMDGGNYFSFCLAILIAASIDVQSLEQSLKPLDNVYTRLTDLYMLWGTVAAALKRLIAELNARSLHAKRTEKQHQEKLFNSLCMIEAVRNGMLILQCI